MKQAQHDTSDIDWYISSIGFGVNPAALRQAFLPEYLRLQALSDEKLLSLGLRRDLIAERVYSKFAG